MLCCYINDGLQIVSVLVHCFGEFDLSPSYPPSPLFVFRDNPKVGAEIVFFFTLFTMWVGLLISRPQIDQKPCHHRDNRTRVVAKHCYRAVLFHHCFPVLSVEVFDRQRVKHRHLMPALHRCAVNFGKFIQSDVGFTNTYSSRNTKDWWKEISQVRWAKSARIQALYPANNLEGICHQCSRWLSHSTNQNMRLFQRYPCYRYLIFQGINSTIHTWYFSAIK